MPQALIAENYFGMVGIFAAYAAANVFTGFVAYAWAKKTVHRLCT